MFKFRMNEKTWFIREDSQVNIQRMMQERGNEVERGSKWYGLTMPDTHTITLDKDLYIDRKRQTLLHELAHCYIVSYICHMDKSYCEEEVADIVANSIDIINRIATEYFNKQDKKGGDKKK